MKKIFLLMTVLVCSIWTAGQDLKGTRYVDRIGHGEDSIIISASLSLFDRYYSDYWKDHDVECFKKSLVPMEYIIDKAPYARADIYRKGTTILETIIRAEADSVQKQRYYTMLMDLLNKRIEHLDALNTISSEKFKTTRGDIICQKAYDYCWVTGRRDSVAYNLFKEGIALMGLDTEPVIFTEYVQCVVNRYNDNLGSPNFVEIRKQVIEDLLEADDIREKLTAKAKAYPSIEIPADTTSADTARWEVQYQLSDSAKYIISCCDNVAYYINYYLPLMADSATLVNNLYTVDNIEANKESSSYLKTAVSILGQNKCENTPNYFLASDYLYALSKTPQSALGKATQCLKDNDINGAITYFEEAISMEDDKDKKIKYIYIVAQLFYQKRNVGQCRAYCRKVLQLSPTYGKAHLMQAKCIAMSANGDGFQRSLYYCLATDYCNRAMKVDPSCTAEAKRLISQYSKYYFPKSEAFFAGNVRVGDVKSVAGETTTVRLR